MLLISFAILPLSFFAQALHGQESTTKGLAQSPLMKCLPSDIKLSDVVDVTNIGSVNGQPVGLRKVTVEQKLNEFKATCNPDNKLVDGSGKQIIFYHLKGCWGNPPPRYQDILKKQRDEINKLKQQFTVIEMTCNPSGIAIP